MTSTPVTRAAPEAARTPQSKRWTALALLAVAQLMLVGQLKLPGINHAQRYPSPLHQTLHVGSFLLRSEHFMVILLVPLIIVGLTLFLNRTPWGLREEDLAAFINELPDGEPER